MGTKSPEWLNADFVKKVLKGHENDESIEVKDIVTKPATAVGDNYTSEMFRVTVEYSRKKNGLSQSEKKSLIVKISPYCDGVQKELVEKVGLFNTEIRMMETTLKKMNDMVRENGYRLGADVLYTEVGNPSLLVIEDLAPLGFRMADRQAGLDLQHCSLAMRSLAKFHASSVAIGEKEPKVKLSYEKGMFNHEHPTEMQHFFVVGFKGLASEVNTWTELGAQKDIIAKKLTNLAEHAYAKAADCGKRNDKEFNVINHGDFWVNNMLFRYDEASKVIDHIFVDFQLCVYTSPAIDLLYFLHTSPSEDVRSHHWDQLLVEYLETLKRYLTKLGCQTKAPSMEALKKSMEDREFFGVISACTILPIVLIEKSQARGLDEILNDKPGAENPAYKGDAIRKFMVKHLPDWLSRGLLDC